MINTGEGEFLKRIEFLSREVTFYLPLKDSDHIQNFLWNTGSFYENKMLQDIYVRFSGVKGLALDVGANIGNHTLFFSGILDLDVCSFEPCLANYKTLERNVELNNLEDKVTIENKAVSKSAGFGRVYNYSDKNTGSTKFECDQGEISVVSIDDYIDKSRDVVLLKIDVEGLELSVLEGARRVIARSKPTIFVEAQNSYDYISIASFLKDLDYTPIGRYNATATYLFVPECTLSDVINSLNLALVNVIRDNRVKFDELKEEISRQSELIEDLKGLTSVQSSNLSVIQLKMKLMELQNEILDLEIRNLNK